MRRRGEFLDKVVVSALIAVTLATVAFGSMRLALGSILGLHYSMLLNGAALSAFFAGRALSATMTGFIYDARPSLARRGPGLGLFGVSATVTAMGVVRNPLLLVVLSGLQGLFSGMVWPLVQTGVAHHSRSSPIVLSLYFALGSVGIAVGRLTYPALSMMLGDYGIFLFAAVFYMAAAVVLVAGFTGLELSSKRASVRGRITQLASAWRSLVFNAASGFSWGLSAQVLYPLLVAREVPRDTAAYALSVGAFAGIPSKIAAAKLAEAAGERSAIISLSVIMLLSLAALGYTPGFSAAMGAAAYLAASAAIVPLARLVAYREGAALGSPASVVGVANTFSNIGSTIAPLLLPMLSNMLPVYAAPLLATSAIIQVGGSERHGKEKQIVKENSGIRAAMK